MKRVFFTLGLIAILTMNCLVHAQIDTGRPPEAITRNQQVTEAVYVEDCSSARMNYLRRELFWLRFLKGKYGGDYRYPDEKTSPTLDEQIAAIEKEIGDFLLNCPDCSGTIDDLNYTQCCPSSLSHDPPANCCIYNPTLIGCYRPTISTPVP